MRWPFGHPLGEPFHVAQQRAVLVEAFNALYSITTPGKIVDIPFRWKREKYNNVDTGKRSVLSLNPKSLDLQ
ncbi:hypothetical protein BMS3Abin07_02494 [bacterium BMS3Abin07]|nr:hypothetical protein BMS3Abin07_02494 [bacterium BMS3Abin07]GBE33391.1 hypothetical protein BMS3Bbin05_02332 [bacterium BMS3Bbin05]